MKIRDIVEDGEPTKEYCKSTPVTKMSARAKAWCRCQGLIPRDTGKSYKHPKTGERINLGGKKIKGEKCGNPNGPGTQTG